MSCCAKIGACNPAAANPLANNQVDAQKEKEIKEGVRNKYGELAKKNDQGLSCGNVKSCCGSSAEQDLDYSSKLGYSVGEATSVPSGANMGLGCGNPLIFASLNPGERVLDLGSGGGFDAFLAARKVGEAGKVIGVDMTQEMIQKATKNAEKGGYKNVEFILGEIEALPIPDLSIDVIISNCVVNLSTNKQKVFAEAARVLKSGGRLAISDIVAMREMPAAIKSDMELYSGCMAGASLMSDIKAMLTKAGFINISIETKEESKEFIKKWSSDASLHIEDYVTSAVIRATKP